MIINYFKIALRNIRKQKGYTAINIFGLAISIACCGLMFLWVLDELSYDRFYDHADRIYRVGYYAVIEGNEMHGVHACSPLARVLVDDFPEVLAATRFHKMGYPVLRYEDKVFSEERWYAADSTFFEVLPRPFIAGDPKTALREPNSLIITRSMAEKYFGDGDPMGKVINSDNRRDWVVTGVVEDIPLNSHFHYDFLASMISYNMGDEPTWMSNNYYTYFLLREGVTWKGFEEKLKQHEISYIEPQIMEMFGATYEQMLQSGANYYHFLQPLTWIHLHSHLEHELEPNGDMIYIYIFIAAAVGVLLLAVVNFVNLSTARSANRAREVGIRKTVGSTRSVLMGQFLTESILHTAAASALALFLLALALPASNQFMGKELHLPHLGDPRIIFGWLSFILVVGLLAGVYPAFILSQFKPVTALRVGGVHATKRPRTRNLLVAFQFIVATILIIGTLIVRQQVNFIQQQNLHSEQEQVVIIHKTDDLGQHIQAFKQSLLDNPSVLGVSNSHVLFGGAVGDDLFKVPGKADEEKRVIHHIFTDADFCRVYTLNMVSGEFFPDDFPPDRRGLVLNESAVRALEMEDPVGSLLELDGKTYPIVGVVKDFHFKSLHTAIAPLILNVLGREAFGGRYLSVRISSEAVQNTITSIQKVWRQFMGNQAFEYEFFDDYYDSMYRAELRTKDVFAVFTIFALFIACLGLFGLSSYTTQQRTKEIGIRKVLGASVMRVMTLMTKDFIKWVLVANVIAWPIAWVAMNTWLQNFAYRVEVNLWMFLPTGVIVVVVAAVTVSSQSIKAALANPVKSLRYE